MNRGKLRVYLGAAPGVGKTFAMLEEGHRLQSLGRDVVVGHVQTYGREGVDQLLVGLEVVPGAGGEVDLDGLLERAPAVVLVDELARHGLGNGTRWHQVERLLDAGIDVLSTLNIEHLESLNDVTASITGRRQPETIPDDVVKAADEIELVDLTHESLRERLAAGQIYSADQIDAALANYFRPGNLSALRELALSWTADRVDEATTRYREAKGIEQKWEVKERVVVAMAGVIGGEAVIRRAARMAMRAGGELIGVYVRPAHESPVGVLTDLDNQRRLLVDMGGTYHEVVGDDVGESLLAFARAENATQIVLGASRRSRIDELLRGSPLLRVVRNSGSIDVHVISHEGARRPPVGARPRSSINRRRRLAGWLIALLALPLATLVMLSLRDRIGLQSVLLLYLLIAVSAAVVGGIGPAVTSALVGFLLGNWFFTPPFHTLTIADPDNLLALIVFLLVATAVGALVGVAARREVEAHRAKAQAEALVATSVYHPVFGDGLASVVGRLRSTFGFDTAAVLQQGSDNEWTVAAGVGEPALRHPDQADETISLGLGTVLSFTGGVLAAEDRKVLRAFAAQAAQAVEREELAVEAATAEGLAEGDRLRTALLSAVSHDLRTPLASIKAAVTSLLETDVDWSSEQVNSFLQTVLTETERLNRLLGQLLDASRLQVGAVHVMYREVGLDEVVLAALTGATEDRSRVRVEVPETLPFVRTDPALLERVVANLIGNSLAWSPANSIVTVSAGEVAGRVDLRVVDRGLGIPAADREKIFQPFHRLGDGQQGSGIGLGLSVSRGFLDAMGHELIVEDTPGGGTTMVISFESVKR